MSGLALLVAAVRSGRSGVLDLARADQYLVGDAADDGACGRRDRMGHVRPCPASLLELLSTLRDRAQRAEG